MEGCCIRQDSAKIRCCILEHLEINEATLNVLHLRTFFPIQVLANRIQENETDRGSGTPGSLHGCNSTGDDEGSRGHAGAVIVMGVVMVNCACVLLTVK